MSELSKAWRKQIQVAVTAFLLAAVDGASIAGQPEITAIDPPEKDFFSDWTTIAIVGVTFACTNSRTAF